MTYRVDVGRKKAKVLHINLLKEYAEREDAVRRMAVVADEVEETPKPKVKLTGECEGFKGEELDEVLNDFAAVFNDQPGKCTVGSMTINTGEAPLVVMPPYRIPARYREQVKEELETLESEGIIVRNFGRGLRP